VALGVGPGLVAGVVPEGVDSDVAAAGADDRYFFARRRKMDERSPLRR
jgi:hypothetical protein